MKSFAYIFHKARNINIKVIVDDDVLVFVKIYKSENIRAIVACKILYIP
jgi:hypothetical protein